MLRQCDSGGKTDLKSLVRNDFSLSQTVCDSENAQKEMEMKYGHQRPLPPNMLIDREKIGMDKGSTDLPADEHTELAEQSYRRGYYQGYWYGMQDFKRYGYEKVTKFFIGLLNDWRRTETLTKTTFPPRLDELKAEGKK